MHSFLLVIFLCSVLLILHTYVLYPLLLIFVFPRKKTGIQEYNGSGDLPDVAVLVAAYNEERVIGEKIVSVFTTSYPLNKLRVYIGSDASIDETDAIIDSLRLRYANLELVKFDGRVGKISIINHLQSLGDEDILVMTDANVIFRPDTLYELVKKFRDERVGIVAANIVKESATNEGIALQEKKYLSLENRIKAAESDAFNLIMGAEGGCYAIRNSLFSKVPLKFIVDDFFITLQVLIRGKFTLFNPDAVCIEDVATDAEGEYRRKVRISSGNFQNLFFFKRLLLRFWTPVGFTFWSHKVLRWLTPFFLITTYISSAFLALDDRFFLYLLAVQTAGFAIAGVSTIVNFRNQFLKFISHFYLMNLALLEGFFRFLKGIQSSIWQPVKRNV
jgi:cellulose synthase/poly-beta-1,6-N-acetylglucosamine synthase-like glycosyltransferase